MMTIPALARTGALSLAIAVGAFAQGKGNGGGGGGGGDLVSPGILVHGQRSDQSQLPGDWLTSREYHPQQIAPSGAGREPIWSVSMRGDLSAPDGAGHRWILDVRILDGYPDTGTTAALVALPETKASLANPTWWLLDANGDGIDDGGADIELLDLSDFDVTAARWSLDTGRVGLQATHRTSGVTGIYTGTVLKDGDGTPVGIAGDFGLLGPEAVDGIDPRWGGADTLAFLRPTTIVDPDTGEPVTVWRVWIHDFVTGSTLEEPGVEVELRGRGHHHCLSDDGGRLAWIARSDPGSAPGRTDIFVKHLATGVVTQVTNDQNVNPAESYFYWSLVTSPVFSPDGTELAFAVAAWSTASAGPNTYRIASDGSSSSTKLTDEFKPKGKNNTLTGRAWPSVWRE